VYKVKYKEEGTLYKYKTLLVAKRLLERKGIDYEEAFSPTTKISTIRLVLAMEAQFDEKAHQMDMKSTLFNGNLKEEVYMYQP
jgi:hypothetical protein